jgi:pilus assembly protein CpaF
VRAAGAIGTTEAAPIRIEIVSPKGQSSVLKLAVKSLTIGRAPECALVLEGRSVSRQHARAEVCANGMLICNLSQTGHTLVEGVPVAEPRIIPFGREITIADYRIRFHSPEDSAKLGDAPVLPKRSSPPAVAGERKMAPVPAPSAAHTPVPSVVVAPADPLENHEFVPHNEDYDRLKRWLREQLLEAIDLRSLSPEELQGEQLTKRVNTLIDSLMDDHARRLPQGLDRPRLRKEITDELLGLGPLEDYLRDPAVSEIMVVDRATIYVEKKGKLTLTGASFSTDDALRLAIERIVTPLGRRIDESTPMVDARLKDGSRVNAVIPPVALRGPCVTIRKFPTKRLGVPDMIAFGSLDQRMATFLLRSVIARCNILVSGGTGSGKTTLLNILSGAIPADERIVTIEDAAELQLQQPHVVSLETRPANMEGKGDITIRELVKNALRMRPDRVVVGECRGGEALDMLQAMNTGHDGSLTTVHANSPDEAMSRLETLVLMGGLDLPTRAIREQIAGAIHLVVQQARLTDGSRKIVDIAEVCGIEEDGHIRTESIFKFVRHDAAQGVVKGEFRATGYLPTYLGKLVTLGLCADGVYL